MDHANTQFVLTFLYFVEYSTQGNTAYPLHKEYFHPKMPNQLGNEHGNISQRIINIKSTITLIGILVY